jgi:membrane protein
VSRLDRVRETSDAARVYYARTLELCERRVPGAPTVFEALDRQRLTGAGLLAGGLAYRLFLWLVPFGLVLAALGSIWAQDDPRGVESAAKNLGLAGVAAANARSVIETGSRGRAYSLAFGIVLLLWFGMGAVRALRITHFIAWRLQPSPLTGALKASLAFNGFVITLVLASTCATWLRGRSPFLGDVAIVLGLFGFYVLLALLALRALPHADAPITGLLPGALLLAVAQLALQVVVVLYLAPRLGRSPEVYGALGAATVVLLWLYVLARLLVAAAFLNASRLQRARPTAPGTTPPPPNLISSQP